LLFNVLAAFPSGDRFARDPHEPVDKNAIPAKPANHPQVFPGH